MEFQERHSRVTENRSMVARGRGRKGEINRQSTKDF